MLMGNMTKDVFDLHTKHKVLLRDIKEDFGKWKGRLCL